MEDYEQWSGNTVYAVVEQIKDDVNELAANSENEYLPGHIFVSVDYNRVNNEVNYAIGTFNEDQREIRLTGETKLEDNGLTTNEIADLLSGTVESNLDVGGVDVPAIMVEGEVVREEGRVDAFPRQKFPDTGKFKSQFV